jgi:hypothetical protein
VAKSGLRPHHFFSPQFTTNFHVSLWQYHGFDCGPALRFLKSDHFLSPQLSTTVDLVTSWVVSLDQWIQLASLFGLWGVSNSLPFLPLKWLSFEVEDLLTPVLSKWMAQMNSGSLAFGSSCSTHSFFSRSDFSLKWKIFCHMSSSNQQLWSTSGLQPFNQDPQWPSVEIHFGTSTLSPSTSSRVFCTRI